MKYVKALLKKFFQTEENLLLIVMEFLFAAKDLGSVFCLAYAADIITGGGHALPAFMLMGLVMLIGVAVSATETWCKEKLLVKLRKRLLDAYEEKLMTIKLEKMEDNENLYMMQHSVAHRRIHDAKKNSDYAISNFAYDQGFGATLRYDFDQDAGQKLTFGRFSPDGRSFFIGTGEVVMGGGYDGYNCSQLVYFKVKDQAKTWEGQCLAGNHCTMVYGDYVKELTDLCESLGVEPVVAD